MFVREFGSLPNESLENSNGLPVGTRRVQYTCPTAKAPNCFQIQMKRSHMTHAGIHQLL